jgi:hypothetical protein
MAIQHSGNLLVRMHRQHFNTLQEADFSPDILPDFQPRALFRASHRAGIVFARAIARPDWIVVSPKPQPTKHPWDIAHEHVRGTAPKSASFAAMGDVYMEPDLLQPALSILPTQGPSPVSAGLNADYPPKDTDTFSPAWHLGPGFGNFQAAWTKGTGKGVRIAHLDTGYWPQHVSTPRNIRPEQGFNFYENNTNLVDPGLTGILDNPGHGTATLALLAGNNVTLKYKNQATYTGPIGGAPDAEIVPIRIGASVIHLYTQPLAQGLDYACAPGDFAPCQVVSLSHGGLPSSAWAEAVNRCYEAGVLVVAASGDSIYLVVANIASHFTVYPSAFNRVVTATGATYAKDPYKATNAFDMQGCWGPDSVMKKAAAGFTPNVPWMKRGTTSDWDMNGAGTSASTPQIAAACALWLGLYGNLFTVPWQRVAACREALLNTLAMPSANLSEIGRGLLDADAMLDSAMAARIQTMAQQGQLQQAPEDEVSFPFWRIIFGIGPPQSSVDQMYETEAAQILARSQNPVLVNAVQFNPTAQNIPLDEVQTWRTAFLAEPDMSNALRARLSQ